MRRSLLALLLLALLPGCSGESTPTGPDGPVPFTTIYQKSTSGIRARRGEIISRESRWIEVWDEIQSNVSPKPAIPSVNFDERLLILGAVGENGDLCVKAQIESVETRSGALQIRVAEVHRPTNCPACPPATSQAVHVVSVPRAATGAAFTFTFATAPTCTLE